MNWPPTLARYASRYSAATLSRSPGSEIDQPPPALLIRPVGRLHPDAQAFPDHIDLDRCVQIQCLARRVTGGHADVGVLVERSLVGEAYLANFRMACRRRGIRVAAKRSSLKPLRMPLRRSRTLHDAKVAAIVHCGFGFGVVFINPALAELDWNPPRFASTAFENAWINPVMWNAFMGWKGVDQYDEADKVGQGVSGRDTSERLDRARLSRGPTARCRRGVNSHLVDRDSARSRPHDR